jgi:hypothetical protein
MLAERLAFLGAVDATEADTFSMVAVQEFEGVAVDQAHNSSGEVGSKTVVGMAKAVSRREFFMCAMLVV